MDKPKRWYNPEAAVSVRVVARDDPNESFCSIRWRHPRVDPTLWECLRYPLADGPGIGLLVLFPADLLAAVAADLRHHRGASAAHEGELGTRADGRAGDDPGHLQLPDDFRIRDRVPGARAGLELARRERSPELARVAPGRHRRRNLALDLGGGRRPARSGRARSFSTGSTAAKSTSSTAWSFPG